MNNQKHPHISQHQTLNGTLMFDWSKDYHQDFKCPECSSDQLSICYNCKYLEKCYIWCKSCRKNTKLSYKVGPHVYKYQSDLSCPNPDCAILGPDGKTKGWIYLQSREASGNRYICHYCKIRFYQGKDQNTYTHPLLSYHRTLSETLTVDWRKDYHNEFHCLKCGSVPIYPCHNPNYPEKRSLNCIKCKHQTPLSCRNRPYIFKYQPGLSCRNFRCTQLGPDGQTKGWIFLYSEEAQAYRYQCHYCNSKFRVRKKQNPQACTYEKQIKAFQFEENTWDLRNFYEKVNTFTINFDFEPYWYQKAAKDYIYSLLKTRAYASGTIVNQVIALRKFSRVVYQRELSEIAEIDREVVKTFINSQQHLNPSTLNDNLKILRRFFESLGLEAHQLIRSRDLLKERQNETDWLDEKVRQEIRKHLDKIPAYIASQYLVQDYTAAHPGDVCLMPFDCLVEEHDQWYIKFYQQKVKRWHRIPANRKIRQVIEAQQQWIQQILAKDYPYLFCHFRSLIRSQYPTFTALQPLSKPPASSAHTNTMVKAIRLLIENEDIRDSNGQRPHFTGKITRPSKLQEVRTKHGLEAAQLYADHKNRTTTYQYYTPPTQEELTKVDLPFQELLLNPNNRFLPWQSLPESLLKNPQAYELDIEIAPRLVVYGHCALDPKVPCPVNLYPKCYGCSSFRPSTGKLPLYERQYQGEKQRMEESQSAGEELAYEEAKTTVEAMDKWLPELRRLANN